MIRRLLDRLLGVRCTHPDCRRRIRPDTDAAWGRHYDTHHRGEA